MKAQQGGGFERKRHFTEPTRFDPEGTQSRDEPILNAQIGCTAPRTVEDQHLMLGQDGFGYDSPKTSGLTKPKNCRDEMDNENEQIAQSNRAGCVKWRLRSKHPPC